MLLSGCASNSVDIKDSLQSTSAMIIKKDFRDIVTLLVELKSELDEKNPTNFDTHTAHSITTNMQNFDDNFRLQERRDLTLQQYHQYLNLAFEKNDISYYRNDLLIVGLYKLLYDAYEMQTKHKVTALSYDVKKMLQAYNYLQVIHWRINNLKDKKGMPLFRTWQKDWQMELLQKLNQKSRIHCDEMVNLRSIISKKEHFLEPSNTTFDMIFSRILYIVAKDLRLIGLEPSSLSIEGIKSIILFL